MPKKPTVSTTKARPAPKASSKVRVVSNRPGSPVTSSLRPRHMGLLVALLFMVVGAGTITWVKAATTSYSLWTNATVPQTIADSDTQSVELGMKFKTQYSGQVTGVRFYKGPQNTGVHRGNVWSPDGKKLASVVFTNETASGWQSANFAKPVDISANTTYTVSYFAPKGHYSVDEGYFTKVRTNGPLSGLKSGVDGGNGVYAYAGKSTFPRQTYKASNYWVDVVYSTSRFSPSPKPIAPTDLTASLSGTNATLTWRYSPSTGVIRYEVLRNGVVVKNDVAGQSWVDSGLSAGTTYSYQVRAVDGTGQTSDLSNTAKVTTAANPPVNPPVTPPTTTPPTTTLPPTDTGSTTACPLPKYPNPTCTGVPAGKSLSTVNGDYVVSTPGAMVNQLHITGSLIIKASNVTITNSQIDGYVSNDITGFPRNHFTIMDSQVGVASSCNTYANGAIGVSNYTAQRVRVINFPDGFRVAGSDTIIEDSYVTPCSKTSTDHSDGLQVYGAAGGTNIIIRHNTIDETHVTNGAANATIFVPGDGARQGNDNLKVDLIADNLIAGGGYPLSVPGPGSPITITITTVIGNKVVNNTWEYHPFGVECSFIGLSSGNAVVTYDFNTGTILSQVSAITDCD